MKRIFLIVTRIGLVLILAALVFSVYILDQELVSTQRSLKKAETRLNKVERSIKKLKTKDKNTRAVIRDMDCALEHGSGFCITPAQW